MDRRQFISSFKAISLLPVFPMLNWIDLPITEKSIEQLCDQILPLANKEKEEDYKRLVSELTRRNYKSISEIRTIVLRHLPVIIEEDRKAVRMLRSKKNCGFIMPKDKNRIKKGIFYQHVGFIRKSVNLEDVRNKRK